MARATSFLCQGNHTLLMQITGAAPAALFLFSFAFPQSLIEYRTHQQGGQTPVHPD